MIIYLISLFFDHFLALTLVSKAFRGIQVCVIYLDLLRRNPHAEKPETHSIQLRNSHCSHLLDGGMHGAFGKFFFDFLCADLRMRRYRRFSHAADFTEKIIKPNLSEDSKQLFSIHFDPVQANSCFLHIIAIFTDIRRPQMEKLIFLFLTFL